MLTGESPGFSPVAVGFLSSYDEDLREPLLGPQGPTRGASVMSSLTVSSEGPLEIPLQSLPGLRSSSGVEAGNSGFLSRADIDLGVPLGRPLGSQASSGVEPCKSALLSSRKSSGRLPVMLITGIGGFFSRRHRAVNLPSCFESVLDVTVESVQGSQVYLQCLEYQVLLKWWQELWSSSRVSS